MPRKSPVVIIFEQHSFSSGSETADRLISENWCRKLGFELPCNMGLRDIKEHYERKIIGSGVTNEKAASEEFDSAIAALKTCETESAIRRVLSVRGYFSAKARLKLIADAENAEIEIHSLDLDQAIKQRLYKDARIGDGTIGADLTAMVVAIPRNEHIVNSIVSLEDVPTVCILGLQHAHEVISRLREKDIKIIPCYVEDAWAPESLRTTLHDSYPPALRKADGLLEFSSVTAAMEKLRDRLLPHTMAFTKRTDTPTSLTSLLSHATGMPFYSVKSQDCIVSAITRLSSEEDKGKAITICKRLGNGSFFIYEGEKYFGLAGINLTGSSELPKKINDTYHP
jgi:hypothetical protein